MKLIDFDLEDTYLQTTSSCTVDEVTEDTQKSSRKKFSNKREKAKEKNKYRDRKDLHDDRWN